MGLMQKLKDLKTGVDKMLYDEVIMESPIMQWEVIEDQKNVQMAFSGQVPPPRYLVVWKLWGKDAFVGMKNPIGILLQDAQGTAGENVKAIVWKNKKTAVALEGSTTHITVREGGIPDTDSFSASLQNIFLKSNWKRLNLKGTIMQHNEIEFKERFEHKTTFSEAVKSNWEMQFLQRPPTYYLPYKYGSLTLHKFIIKLKNESYYAVDYLGEIIAPIDVNTEIEIINGDINGKDRVVKAAKLGIGGVTITEEPSIPLRSSDFKEIKKITGRIESLMILHVHSTDIKEWLLSKSRIFDRDNNIELFKDYLNEMALEIQSKEFRLPCYSMIIADEKGKQYITLFRPIWFTDEMNMWSTVSIPHLTVDGKVEVEAMQSEIGVYIVKSLRDMKTEAVGYSTVDENTSPVPSSGVNEISGTVASDMLTLNFGLDVDQLKYHPSILPLIDSKLSQVIFQVLTDDGQYISCKTTSKMLQGTEDVFDPRIPHPQAANIHIRARGKYSSNNVFEIEGLSEEKGV